MEAKLKSGEKVVVLVRPLGAQLPHKDDCKATRWSKNDYKKQHTLDERLRFVAEDRIREGNQ